MHLMGSIPEKKLENCPCIISLSLARVTLTHTMPPIVHSKPRTGRLPRAACLTPCPNTSTGKPHVHPDPTRTGRFLQQGFPFRCVPPGYLAAIQRELPAVHLASHIQQYLYSPCNRGIKRLGAAPFTVLSTRGTIEKRERVCLTHLELSLAIYWCNLFALPWDYKLLIHRRY